VTSVEGWLEDLYVGAEGATLRKEDRRKACQVSAMLEEVARAIGWLGCREPVLLVDAAAGKSYVGVLAARLVLQAQNIPGRVVAIERDASRVAASLRASERLDAHVVVECRHGDVGDLSVWPLEPSLIVALHACGPAADAIIDAAIAVRARALLLVPCCTSRATTPAQRAEVLAERSGIPRHAPVRRRFVQALVDAERTWRLEAAGFQTEVVEFVGGLVTPHNLLWRARHVGEPGRMARAQTALEQLQSGPRPSDSLR
jgi:hypothetical protein